MYLIISPHSEHCTVCNIIESPFLFAHHVARLTADLDTVHETVNHSADEWVRGKVHTNTAESVWSLFDRSVIGAFHHVSIKHIDLYAQELEWRFNNRGNPWLFRDTLLKLLTSENLEYQDLVAAQ